MRPRNPTVIDFNVKLLKVYGGLALVIHQLRGEWETRDHKLIPYQAYIKKLAEFFDDVSFHHVPERKIRWRMRLPLWHPCFS